MATTAEAGQPALGTAQLLADQDAAVASSRPSRRSARDWLVDVGAFLICVLIGSVLLGARLSEPTPPSDGVVAAEFALGLLAALALWGRRRRPVAVAVGTAVAATFSDMAGVAALLALFTVAVQCPRRVLAWITGLNLVSTAVAVGLRPDPTVPYVGLLAFGLLLTGAIVGWGMLVRARRELVVSLRDRAARAESEQRLRVEQARQLERTRIAREMHDVLAHRISLLSMHAGALEFRPNAPAEDVARAAGVIRSSAHQALQDLREILGVLRAGPESAGGRPQPTLTDLPALVEENRQAGTRVTCELDLTDLAALPTATGRTAYRIVQECLTNARRHAPGAAVGVAVNGRPGLGLRIEVSNGPGRGDEAPSAGGMGLIGLRERTSLAGGRLEHGSTPDGGFGLCAELPWGATP